MTLKEAVSKFDTECRNTIPAELKIDWLSLLDASIFKEIILTHENPNAVSYSPYTIDTDEDTVLLVPDPYSDIYLRFLVMRADLYHGDISRYNNHLILYSAAYSDFESYYNRTFLPLKKTTDFNI